MNKDFTVSSISQVPNNTISRKPHYLLHLNGSFEDKFEKFICVDSPEVKGNFIIVRGFFTLKSEEDINKEFLATLTNVDKDAIFDMWFPTHRVVSLKNLNFLFRKG